VGIDASIVDGGVKTFDGGVKRVNDVNIWVQSQSNEPTMTKDSRIAILFVVIFILS